MPYPILVQCPTPSHHVAHEISEALLENGLAASVHIREVKSRYRWEGTTHTATEWVLDIKTRRDTFDSVAECIRELHPYELPGIWAIAVDCAIPEYAAWILSNSQGPSISG